MSASGLYDRLGAGDFAVAASLASETDSRSSFPPDALSGKAKTSPNLSAARIVCPSAVKAIEHGRFARILRLFKQTQLIYSGETGLTSH
jgi:hypothetical protein